MCEKQAAFEAKRTLITHQVLCSVLFSACIYLRIQSKTFFLSGIKYEET